MWTLPTRPVEPPFVAGPLPPVASGGDLMYQSTQQQLSRAISATFYPGTRCGAAVFLAWHSRLPVRSGRPKSPPSSKGAAPVAMRRRRTSDCLRELRLALGWPSARIWPLGRRSPDAIIAFDERDSSSLLRNSKNCPNGNFSSRKARTRFPLCSIFSHLGCRNWQGILAPHERLEFVKTPYSRRLIASPF